MRLSATDFPEKNRVEAVREIFGKSIIRVNLEPTPGDPFRFDAMLYALPGLKIAVGDLSPVRGTLTKELIESDDLLFNITLSGGRTLHQRGREAAVRPGEAGLTTSIYPGVVEVHLPSRFISFRIPRNTLQPMIGDLDGCLLRTIPRHTGALRLLTGYASLFEENEAVIGADMGGLAEKMPPPREDPPSPAFPPSLPPSLPMAPLPAFPPVPALAPFPPAPSVAPSPAAWPPSPPSPSFPPV